MKKIKLLLATCALLGGVLSSSAQTDVTSTYLTNADFEGDYSSYNQPKSDRDIYQPTGWNISYTNGNENDLTSMCSSTTNWSNFSGKPQPTNGGSKAYWMRYRWGASENITLSQETSANLPEGTYCISAEAYSDDNTGTVTISAAGLSKTVRTDGAWAKYTLVFTLASAQKVTISLSYTNTAADDQVAAFDNVKILDLSSEPTGITLKNDLSGTAASLSDFNVWYNDYTLEVESTAGTEITVAADNISYTPEATGTVRFVKKDGIVYVFEGTAYKGAIHSSKADYTYARSLSGSDSSTGNILANESFETPGDVLTASKAWKLGSPWVVANFSWGGDGSGIRVQANGDTKRLVWRGSGNNAYFSQPLSLKLYKGYKVYLQQVGGGNATAKFNIGIGNAAGDYSYLSTQMTLGNGKNGTYNAVLGANENIPASGAYFTFRNTSSNTASSGSDPVTQLDWIGLVYSDDFPITGVSSASYVYGTAYAPATAKSSYLAAKEEAEATIADATYDNVTGSERTALQAAIDADVEDNDAAYNAATEDIQTKQSAFTAALTHYQALIDAQDAVPDLAYASIAASAFKTAVATSADDADTKLAAMTTNIRAYYESHALAEGNARTVNYTHVITNPDAMNANNGWTWTGPKNDPKNAEPWTDASGNSSHWYFDGGDWNAGSWTTTMSQDITLPAGTYLLTAKGRAATNTTLTMTACGKDVVLPHVSSTGNVFNNGWGDASLEFTSDGSDVTITVTATTGTSHEWFSVCDFRLVRLDATLATSEDYNDLNNAIDDAEAKTLGFEDKEYAPYANAGALAKLIEAKAVNQAINNEQSDVQALTTYLNTSSNWTANDGDVDIIYNGTFAEANGNNPKGWTRSNNAWGQQITDLTTDDNDVDAETTTAWYYNTNGAWEYGKDDVYKMPLAASQAYKLTFKYRSHSNNSNNSMKASVLNDSDEGLSEVTFAKNGDATKFVTATAYFTTGAAGNYVLSLTQNGNTHLTDVSLVKVASATLALNEGVTYEATDRTYHETVTLARTIKADKWNTFCVPFDMSAEEITDQLGGSAEVKELTDVTQNGDNYTLTFSGVDEIEAGKPYMVKVPSDVSTITLSDKTIVEDITPTIEGDVTFTGTYTNGYAPMGSFIISNNAFYLVNTDSNSDDISEVALKAFRGYFTVDSVSPVKALNFDFDDDATGISTTLNDKGQMTNDNIYNVAGQRMSKLQKGINIVNGKKILK